MRHDDRHGISIARLNGNPDRPGRMMTGRGAFQGVNQNIEKRLANQGGVRDNVWSGARDVELDGDVTRRDLARDELAYLVDDGGHVDGCEQRLTMANEVL